jgi:hypothetical protein
MNTPLISKVDFLPHDDCLRFVQRVLESNAPEQDREEALAMVCNMRRAVRDEDNTLAKVKAQRDELLVALEDLVLGTPINEFNRSDDGLGCHFGNYEKREKAARAAIAKAQASEPAPHRCKFCDSPSWVDPSDQSPPPDYCHESDHGEPAPKREWVGLTTDEMKEVADRYHLKPPNVPAAFRAIEAKLKERLS